MASRAYIESLAVCPFDPTHRIEKGLKLCRHIVKCKRNHPNVRLIHCPLNNSHYVKQHDLQSHLDNYHSADLSALPPTVRSYYIDKFKLLANESNTRDNVLSIPKIIFNGNQQCINPDSLCGLRRSIKRKLRQEIRPGIEISTDSKVYTLRFQKPLSITPTPEIHDFSSSRKTLSVTITRGPIKTKPSSNSVAPKPIAVPEIPLEPNVIVINDDNDDDSGVATDDDSCHSSSKSVTTADEITSESSEECSFQPSHSTTIQPSQTESFSDSIPENNGDEDDVLLIETELNMMDLLGVNSTTRQLESLTLCSIGESTPDFRKKRRLSCDEFSRYCSIK